MINAIIPQISADKSSPSTAVVPKYTRNTCTSKGVPLINSMYTEAIDLSILLLPNFISANTQPIIAPATTPKKDNRIVILTKE